MPNTVGNHVLVTGPDSEIERLLATCFAGPRDANGKADPANLELDFQLVIPVDESNLVNIYGTWAESELYDTHWGTTGNAADCNVVERRPGVLTFEFTTTWNSPDPIYRELGRMFPQLEFDIAATDPEAWAVTIQICGDNALFKERADFRAVYERVYKEPPIWSELAD